MTTYRYLCLAVFIVAICVQQIKAGVKKPKKDKSNGIKIDSENNSPEDTVEDLKARMIDMHNGTAKKPKSKNKGKMKGHAQSMENNEDEGQVSEKEGIMKRSVRRQKRSFLTNTDNRWPLKIVPYMINASMLSASTVPSLMYAMEVFRNNTCIDWQPYTSTLADELGHQNYVLIRGGSVCSSNVGMKGNGFQDLILREPDCTNIDTIVHEMGHAVGMHHTHQRQDRDDYVTILWHNIYPTVHYENFYKVDTADNVPYDYGSIQHYFTTAFQSWTGLKTISFMDSKLEFLPLLTLNGLSFYDIWDATIAYNCTSQCVSNPACQYGSFVNFNCQCHCPEGLTGTNCTQTDSTCGSIFELQLGEEKIINSTNYGNGTYPLGQECVWAIKAPAGMLVSMTVDDFHVSDNATSSNCYHFLEIRYNLMGQPGFIVCGHNWTLGTLTTTLTGDRNLMMLKFNSAFVMDKDPSQGFSLRVRARDLLCTSHPCENGGTCTENSDGLTYTCSCTAGFAGDVCDLIVIGTVTLSCTYEIGTTCFIENDATGDDFDWTVHSGPTLSPNTGPPAAHNGQFYNYIELSSPRLTGDVARLDSSRYFFTASERCLVFYYHMYGQFVDTLKIYKQGTNLNSTVIWSKTGNQGNQWLKGHANLASVDGLKVTFEGNKGSNISYGWQGDIAIDDISLLHRKCLCESDPCQNGGICDENSDGMAFTCACAAGFAGDVCNHPTHIENATVSCIFNISKWCFLENVPTNVYTGDNYDWKFDGGVTWVWSAYPNTTGNVALMVSSNYSFTAIPRCLVIKNYYMYYSSLKVFTQGWNLINGYWYQAAKTEIWSTNVTNNGFFWDTDLIPIIPGGLEYLEISVEGDAGTEWGGIVAINEILLVPFTCANYG